MDRLSELPDSIIFHIFWLLPITNVVRTTILSKRWENLWTSTPYLNLYHDWEVVDDYEDESIQEHRNFLNRALLCWNGVRLLKFKFDSENEPYLSIYTDIDLWVGFAKHNRAEELYLHIQQFDTYVCNCDELNDAIYLVPQCLYSCSSLKVLSIKSCYFRIKGSVQWNHLKSLTIIDGFGVNGDVVNQILCGSPQLEVLIMPVVESGKSLCIRSTSLKQLSINKHIDDKSTSKTELRIWTPNLETLETDGLAYTTCLLMNVSSLNCATFGYSGLHRSNQKYCDGCSGGVDGCLSTNHFLGDLFGQTLPSIQHVENVTLLSCCLKVLIAMIEGCMNSSSPNVKSLQFRFYYTKDGVIEIFPLSKKLVVNVGERTLCANPNMYLKFEENLPMSFVLQLRTVEVILVEEGDIIFPLLEFLLRNASKLEKIVFRVKGFTRLSRPSESLLRASQRLLKMPRSSRTAHFTFYEY
ncbi:F-box/LRR-repeat protein At3g26922-like [Salvia miltiorrhiza]|uniref:F-box/LRR-repeat protein At3g26922-like n=1 Tax=Salvia miltiorrhiza TaxID=226208 RepID=UPI0025AD8067|nr:F-box/LRR-repeat protein At3g26922-like [Salvia miltiorrhiza]